MPMVEINPRAGPANVSYTISTPTCSSAEKIDPDLPTVILIHPVYIAQYIFQTQFSDPNLRRFNLIGVDTRLHGDTKGQMKSDWGSEDAAHDLAAFMDALELPPCHFLGLSMGTRIALQLSISYPDKALSLFLVSPLPVQEPKEVGEGRQEIYECWRLGWNDSKQPDLIVLKDSMLGGIELAFNSAVTPIIKALVKLTLPHAIVNFGPGRFEEFHTAAVDFFAEDVDYSKEKLSRIRCPIKLLYCGADIAYPLHYAEELLQRLVDAGVHAELTVVEDAPHFGTVTNFNEINPSLHDFIMQHTSSNVPLALGSATSPYEPILVATGWSPEPRSSDSSEEEELFDQLDYSIPTTTE